MIQRPEYTFMPMSDANPALNEALRQISDTLGFLSQRAQILDHMHYGSGVPGATLGRDGDYYFRFDPVGATHIYFKSSGSWSAIA
jgi:hypothetical protein